jgi:hypothetical protein
MIYMTWRYSLFSFFGRTLPNRSCSKFRGDGQTWYQDQAGEPWFEFPCNKDWALGHHPSIPRGVSLNKGPSKSDTWGVSNSVQNLIVFHPCQPHSAILLRTKLFLFTYSKRKIQRRGGWYWVPSNDMIWGLLKSWGSPSHHGCMYLLALSIILALGTPPWLGNLYDSMALFKWSFWLWVQPHEETSMAPIGWINHLEPRLHRSYDPKIWQGQEASFTAQRSS